MLTALWVVAPVLGAYIAHAPVLKFDLFRSLAKPIDGGATFRAHRIFGANKTWRGAIVMLGGVAATTLVAAQIAGWSRHWPDSLRAHSLELALLLGLGFVTGELPNSFLKRQLEIQPGSQRRSAVGVALSIFDQADFVPGIWLALTPLWIMPVLEALELFVIAVGVHLLINVIGFRIGARKTFI